MRSGKDSAEVGRGEDMPSPAMWRRSNEGRIF